MPSTNELTQRIQRLQFPAAVQRSIPVRLRSDLSPIVQEKTVPILPLVYQALAKEFDYVDFELILHAIEQLEPVVASSNGQRIDRYRAVLSSFVSINQNLNGILDAELLAEVRRAIITEIYRTIIGESPPETSKAPLALPHFIRSLEEEFDISVFTLNYDDVVDRARQSWFDGFTRQVEHSTCGPVWTSCSFDPSEFVKWREATEPLLCHLHGSVRFGYIMHEVPTGKYSNTQAAFDSITGISAGDTYDAGAIVSASPIISGLSKTAKLVHNPEPFGYYYRAFMDSILSNKRLLVIGYGARDDHINLWLKQFLKVHAMERRVVWIGKLSGDNVGRPTNEKDMIRLLSGNQFQESINYDNPRTDARFQRCGPLGLVPSGFPISEDITGRVVEFLR